MENIIKKNFYQKIILLIIIFLLSSGGDSFCSNSKNIYQIIAEKSPKGIKTTFQVWAESKRDAKEHVTLNGWKVLEIKKIYSPEPIVDTFNNTNNNSNHLIYSFDSRKIKFISKIMFKTGKYIADFSPLDNISFNPQHKYLIYGYADSLPVKPNKDFKTNYELSILRAKKVKNYILNHKKIDAENLIIVGFGEFYPFKDNGFKGESANRRVEIYEYQ